MQPTAAGVIPDYSSFDFGLQFRIESILCRKLNEAECPKFDQDQKCKIDFEIGENSSIKNVKITGRSGDPAFEHVATKVILDSVGSPELKLPLSETHKNKKVSSTFYKAGTWRWVVVTLPGNTVKPITRVFEGERYGFPTQIPDEHVQPRPTDRQMLEFKNEHGERRFKLVPVNINSPPRISE